ncbi:MAG: histidinol-phosphatase HisJ family protein [Lachnospiraceae bacterium]|nr:histidinol-phosphatase HisJ family protein [Lachnospiraceae bacterium]
MLPDTHIHTSFSGDCTTPARIQIERCLSLGMQELCITDHHDYATGMAEEIFLLDFPSYLSQLHSLQEEYSGRIRIGIGLELGLQIRIQDYLERLARSLDVDYIIGSCHFIDQMDPYYPSFFQGRTERAAYERFFEVSLKRIQTLSCFDSFGHLDYVVRYGPATNQNYSFSAYQDYIDPILKTLIEKEIALECNTAGFKYGLGHPNPTEDILRRYHQLGGERITLGSDAHTPEYIGHAFDRAKSILIDCGFRYLTVYRQRKPQWIPL